jgi:hypothetical protein
MKRNFQFFCKLFISKPLRVLINLPLKNNQRDQLVFNQSMQHFCQQMTPMFRGKKSAVVGSSFQKSIESFSLQNCNGHKVSQSASLWQSLEAVG